MSEKVSDEALGIRESGSSYRSSVQVPPLTGVPADGVPLLPGLVVGAPHALNSKISSEKRERTIAREWGLVLLSIRSSSDKKTTTKRFVSQTPGNNTHRCQENRPVTRCEQ